MSNKAFHSNIDFSHEAYISHYENQEFYGYEAEMSYLSFFLKNSKKETIQQIHNNHGQPIQDERIFEDANTKMNFPLVVTGDEGCGKTALVIKWLTSFLKNQQAPNQKCPHTIITHFAGVSGCDKKYQSFIFRTLVKLRQEFDIQHRVEIIDDKLRMNFSRWLELANQKHSERMEDPNSRIIIVLDSPENFIDQDTMGEESADWVPWTFPQNVKLILITKKTSKAMNHFKLRKYPILYVDAFGNKQIQQMIDNYVSLDFSGEGIHKKQLDRIINYLLNQQSNDNSHDHLDIEITHANDEPRIIREKSPSPNESAFSSQLLLSVGNNVKYQIKKQYFRSLMKTADDCQKIQKQFNGSKNPFIINCVLHFSLLFNKYEIDEELLYQVPMNYEQILESQNAKQLLIQALQHFRVFLFGTTNEDHIKFDQLLGYLYITRKGITKEELNELIPTLSDIQFNRFLSIFGFLLIKNKEYYFIKHKTFKKSIKEAINIIKKDESKVLLHRNLSNVIEKQPFSQRQIDELSYQYFMGKSWIKLKDLISNIEVFSMMFVPEVKYELAQYWQALEIHKYDPVTEYNKALEGFVVKYRPNNQELFVILIQLSRFFKELADLETEFTPQFKHPPLRGQSDLESITLYRELQKLDDLYTGNASNAQIVMEPLLGDLENFNVDNTIVREQIMSKIKKQLEEQKQEKGRESLNAKEDKPVYYYYKRWIWVQFPWCTIDVYSNLSNIMEMSMGSQTSYISTMKENELVNGTIQILKEAKLRKRNRHPVNLNSSSATKHMANNRASRSMSQGHARSLSQSRNDRSMTQQSQAAANVSAMMMAKRQSIQTLNEINYSMTMGTNNKSQVLLPPISAKASQTKQLKSSKFLNQSGLLDQSQSRLFSNSQQRININKSQLTLQLEAEDRKKPEKFLVKLSDKIQELEKQELFNFEQQNLDLGSDLNSLTFQIKKKERELRFLEELFIELQTEESLNNQEKTKLENTEAKLLKAYENLNRVEVEKKRLEQIFTVCSRNPAKNQEWIRNMESQVDSLRKLVNFQQNQIQSYKSENEDLSKQLVEVKDQMLDKRRMRDDAIRKVSKILEQKYALDQKVAQVGENRIQILKGTEGPEKTINKLKQRQIVYRKWIQKLQVTKAFVMDKKRLYEKAFRKITAVTGISNPNDIEGLLSFIEKTNDLRKTKTIKEKKVERLKSEKQQLEEELRNFQNGAPQYDLGHIEKAQKRLQEKEKKMRDIKNLNQKTLCMVADIKSGLVNIAKKLKLPLRDLTKIDQLQPFVDSISDRINNHQSRKSIDNKDLSPTRLLTLNDADAVGLNLQRASGSIDASFLGINSQHQITLNSPIIKSMDGDNSINQLPLSGKRGPAQRKKQPKQKNDSDIMFKVQSLANVSAVNQTMQSKGSQIIESVDSDNEERDQIIQERLRLKKGGHGGQRMGGNSLPRPLSIQETGDDSPKKLTASTPQAKLKNSNAFDRSVSKVVDTSLVITGNPGGKTGSKFKKVVKLKPPIKNQ